MLACSATLLDASAFTTLVAFMVHRPNLREKPAHRTAHVGQRSSALLFKHGASLRLSQTAGQRQAPASLQAEQEMTTTKDVLLPLATSSLACSATLIELTIPQVVRLSRPTAEPLPATAAAMPWAPRSARRRLKRKRRWVGSATS